MNSTLSPRLQPSSFQCPFHMQTRLPTTQDCCQLTSSSQQCRAATEHVSEQSDTATLFYTSQTFAAAPPKSTASYIPNAPPASTLSQISSSASPLDQITGSGGPQMGSPRGGHTQIPVKKFHSSDPFVDPLYPGRRVGLPMIAVRRWRSMYIPASRVCET